MSRQAGRVLFGFLQGDAQFSLLRGEASDRLGMLALFAFQPLLQRLEFLPGMVDLLMRTILDGAWVLLGAGTLAPQGVEFHLVLIEVGPQAVALLHQVSRLGRQLIHQDLALAELAFRQGPLGSVFGDARLGLGEGDIPHFGYLCPSPDNIK